MCMEVVVVRGTTIPGARILQCGTCCLLVLSMELASCVPYGACRCKVAARFFENLYILSVIYCCFREVCAFDSS
jgi:hypothetical protein